MTPEQFCYWLQGRAEMQPDNPPSAEEWKMIVDHLQLVFRKETPVRASAASALAIAAERINRERSQQQQPPFGSGMPQCGIGQSVQFGISPGSVC